MPAGKAQAGRTPGSHGHRACALTAALLSVAAWLAVADAAAPNGPIRLAGVVYLGDLPTVVADHEGLFARHGLDVVVEYNPSGKHNLKKLRAGDTDFALMALTPLVLDRLADTTPGEVDDPVILASLVHSIRFNQVVARADSGIETPTDLRGRRIGLHKGTKSEFVWWVFRQYHGLEANVAEVLDLPVARVSDALLSGDIDAAVIWEPWTIRLRERPGVYLKTFIGANFYTAKWVLVTSRRMAREAPDRCAAMLEAYGQAIESMEREPEGAIRAYGERTGLEADVLRSDWGLVDYYLNLDWSIVAALQEQLSWARAAGHGGGGAGVDVLTLFEPGPLHAVRPAAVGIPRPAAVPWSAP